MGKRIETDRFGVCADCFTAVEYGLVEGVATDWDNGSFVRYLDEIDGELVTLDGDGYFSRSVCPACDGLPGQRYDVALIETVADDAEEWECESCGVDLDEDLGLCHHCFALLPDGVWLSADKIRDLFIAN